MSTILIPLLFVLLWSTGFIFSKFGLPYAEPAGFLALRFGIAALILVALMLVVPRLRPVWPGWQLLAHAAVSGVLLQAVYLGGVFSAISLGISAGLSSLIVGLQPLLTVIFAAVILHETLSWQKIAGVVCGLAGVVLVILARGQLDGSLSVTGLFFCVAALLGISVGTVYQKRFCNTLDLLTGATTQYVASVAFLLPWVWLFESGSFDWHPRFVFALSWLVVALSLGAVFLLLWLIRVGEAGRVASLFYLVPPVVALEAWVLFDEAINAWVILGTVLCISGVALVALAPSQHRSPKP